MAGKPKVLVAGEKLVEAVRRHPTSGKSSRIGFADYYLSDIEGCFDGGVCPTKLFESVSVKEWDRFAKEAATKTVYHNPDMVIKAEEIRTGGLATPKACMEFDCVLTSVTRDRDGDVLLPKGCELDEKMPLLWQHLMAVPIGKFLRVVSRDDQKIEVSFAIMDTPFGRDVASFIEFGCLRMSHGFIARNWVAIGDKDDPDGYKVTDFLVAEGSVVSIPSNPDAEITAYSRGKLAHPVAKSYARKLLEDRPQMVPSGFGSLKDFYEATEETKYHAA